MKQCSICKIKKNDDLFYKHPKSKDGLASHCKQCHSKLSHDGYVKKRSKVGIDEWRKKTNETMRNWRKNNIDKAREKSRYYREKNREKYNNNRKRKAWEITKRTLLFYGGSCQCCGETDIRFLTLDHIEGGGNRHRKDEKISFLAGWAFKKNFPKILRVLCFNCNLGRQTRGGREKICPHLLKEIA